ncbi:MAG TPA: Ig-like domain-containing protein, partial [Desulfurivibrionaceae bacterium]|nr:Ig-like domain-containing protein [Desulfurivibrionaceae bacterium]
SFVLSTNWITRLDEDGPQTFPNWALNISAGPPDESSQILTFLVSNNASNLFQAQPSLTPDGTLTFNPTPGLTGQAVVTVQLRDNGLTLFGGRDTSPPQSFTIEILPANKPPVALAETFNLLEDQPLTETVSATDPDDDPLTFRLLNAPVHGTVVLNTNTGAFTYTPPANFNGLTDFTFIALDGLTSSAPAIITLQVQAVNDPPTFTAGPPIEILEDAGAQTLPNWASGLNPGPADEAGQSLAFVVSTDNSALFAAPPAISPDGTLTFTPAAQRFGVAQLQIILQDNGGTANGGLDASPAQAVTLTIQPVNDAPAFAAGPDVTVHEDAGPQTIPAWASAITAGPENEADQTLTFQVSTDNGALFAAPPAISPTGDLTFTPADQRFGETMVTVILRDDGGTENGGTDQSPAQTFTLTIEPVNDAPSFVKG